MRNSGKVVVIPVSVPSRKVAMDSFEDRLAEAVRKYEHLYNTSCKTYKDTQMTNNSWKEIARTLCTEESVCRKRWINLRDKFAKAKRRVLKKKSGDPGGRKLIPALYTSLQWLDAHIKPRKTTTNVTVSQAEEIDSNPEEGPSFTHVTQTSSHVSSQFPTNRMTELGSSVLVSPSKVPALLAPTPQPPPLTLTPVPTPPSTIPSSPTSPAGPAPRSKKRKRGSETCLNFEAALAALDKRRVEREAAMEAGRQRRDAMLQLMDPCGRYVLHVADFMRTLPPELLSDFKWKLQNLMHETEQKLALFDVNIVQI